ncbi:MAG: hypothetical protein HQL07_06815 [Nitrospirae bacterium]|nr:hypothetical protein [Magnetococcales bacterium]HAT49733.1 hypothetical protein [Alphaproteobacteria bacterium]
MNDICRKVITGMIVFAALLLILPENVYAQSGKRICGRWAQTAGGYVGLLIEVQNKAAQASTVCDQVRKIDQVGYVQWMQSTDPAMEALQVDVNGLTWVHQSSTACENVGKMFTDSKYTSSDMCDNMEGYYIYVVVKNNGTTTYFKKNEVSALGALVSASVSIAKSELNAMAATVKSVYSSAASAVQAGYDESVAALKSAWTAALEALFREVGGKFISDNKTVLTNIRNNLKNLDTDSKVAYTRIQRALSDGEITSQMVQDMKTVVTALKMVPNQAGASIPSNVTNSSVGIPLVGVDAGLIVGVEANISFVMNLTPDSSGKYAFAIVSYAGGTLGATMKGEVDGGGLGISWSPGTIDDNQGWSVGFGVGAALGAGADMGLSWNVSKGMSGASNAIPGFSLSTASGAGVDGSFSAGYTKVLVKSTF